MTRHYLSLNDISKEELIEILDLASELKQDLKSGKDHSHLLKNKSLGLVFQKPSLRTRVSFELGMKQLGGHTVVLKNEEINMGNRESIDDIAKVFSQYLDALMVRTYGQSIVDELAQESSIPVINALTDLEHPCQALADLLTIKEHFGSFEGLKVAFIGDGNNTCRSLMLACTKLGMQFELACPKGFEPGKEYESEFTTISHGVGEASKNADVIYTDVWISMGQEDEMKKRKEIFDGYQVNTSLLDEYANPGAIVLHCLPAHREFEITDEVLKRHEATILNQAQNRLHTQKALLVKLLS